MTDASVFYRVSVSDCSAHVHSKMNWSYQFWYVSCKKFLFVYCTQYTGIAYEYNGNFLQCLGFGCNMGIFVDGWGFFFLPGSISPAHIVVKFSKGLAVWKCCILCMWMHNWVSVEKSYEKFTETAQCSFMRWDDKKCCLCNACIALSAHKLHSIYQFKEDVSNNAGSTTFYQTVRTSYFSLNLLLWIVVRAFEQLAFASPGIGKLHTRSTIFPVRSIGK